MLCASLKKYVVEVFSIISQQSTAKPGCIIELDAITDFVSIQDIEQLLSEVACISTQRHLMRSVITDISQQKYQIYSLRSVCSKSI